MNKLLAKAVLFMSQIAILMLWTGLIAWCIVFALNQWKTTAEILKAEVKGFRKPLSRKDYRVIESNKQW